MRCKTYCGDGYAIFWMETPENGICCYSKNVNFRMSLIDITIYHTIPRLNDADKDAFWKHCAKWRKYW